MSLLRDLLAYFGRALGYTALYLATLLYFSLSPLMFGEEPGRLTPFCYGYAAVLVMVIVNGRRR